MIDVDQVMRDRFDRCTYCQRKDYTVDNPKEIVIPALNDQPALVAHKTCVEERIQAAGWRW